MIKWIPLTRTEQIDTIKTRSATMPCLIFKHSTRCSISSMALRRFEQSWDFREEEVEAYFLDLITYRQLSGEIADSFGVYHESPQVLLVREGKSTYDASHLDISVSELRECFEDTF